MGRLYRGPAEYEFVAQFAKIALSANSATLITYTSYLLSICSRNNWATGRTPPTSDHYGAMASRETTSWITDKLVAVMTKRCNRPTESVRLVVHSAGYLMFHDWQVATG